jgi:hypothetical protein
VRACSTPIVHLPDLPRTRRVASVALTEARWQRQALRIYREELSITNSTNFAIFSRVRSPEFEM